MRATKLLSYGKWWKEREMANADPTETDELGVPSAKDDESGASAAQPTPETEMV